MSKIFTDNSQSIGNTPLVRINNITRGAGAVVLAKIEGRNPAGSVKCRVAANMIWDAEKKGILMPGSNAVTVVEPTSGNTGIGLAFVCALRGYPIVLTMPETMSMERRRILAGFGAKILLTDGAKGMKGSIDKANELLASDPRHYFCPQQFSNPANPQIHFATTAPEIYADTDGKTDILVAGVGSGGTITGIARYFKEYRHKAIKAVAVEPANSAVITALKAGKTPQAGAHKIQGIGAGFKPEVLDLSLVDETAPVTDDEAFEYARRLHREEGITCGISGGAAMCAADKLARLPENAGKTIVIILPDAGERYLSSAIFD